MRYAWVQMVFAPYDWAPYAEAASNYITKLLAEIEKGIEYPTIDAGMHGWVPYVYPAGKKTLPHPLEGSSVAEWGRAIAKEYFAKGQSYPLLLEIRGLVVGEEHTIEALNPVFGSIKTEGELDYPGLWPYYSPRVVRWLRSRGLADPSKELLMHAEGGLMQPWGYGRELIPALCLIPEELPVFVHLPLAQGLPVEYVRGETLPSTPLREDVEGPSLWD